jgi:hypothetical protein
VLLRFLFSLLRAGATSQIQALEQVSMELTDEDNIPIRFEA